MVCQTTFFFVLDHASLRLRHLGILAPNCRLGHRHAVLVEKLRHRLRPRLRVGTGHLRVLGLPLLQLDVELLEIVRITLKRRMVSQLRYSMWGGDSLVLCVPLSHECLQQKYILSKPHTFTYFFFYAKPSHKISQRSKLYDP